MAKIPEIFWDHKTQNRIRTRVLEMTDEQLIIRECNRTVKRSKLIKEWALAGFLQRRYLLMHLDDCIRLVEFELDIIHNLMKKRGLLVWDVEFMKEEKEE